MSDAGQGNKANIIAQGNTGKFESPAQRLSMPEFVDWHMILDHELSQLTRPETGVIGSLGFVGLGGAIGLAPTFVAVLSNVQASPPKPVTVPDIAAVGCFAVSFAVALICLVIFGLSVYRNKGLATSIRERKKQDFSTHSAFGGA